MTSLISSLRAFTLCSIAALSAACAAPVEVESDELSVAATTQALQGPQVTPAQIAQIRAAFLHASAVSPAVRQAFASEVDITFRQGIPMGCTAGRVAYALPMGKLLSRPAVYPAILAEGVNKAMLDAVIAHPGVRPIRLMVGAGKIPHLKDLIQVSNPRGYSTLDFLTSTSAACNTDAALLVSTSIADFYDMVDSMICSGGVEVAGDEVTWGDVCSALQEAPGNAKNVCRDLGTDVSNEYTWWSAAWDTAVDAADTAGTWLEGAWESAEDAFDPNGDPDGDHVANKDDSNNHDATKSITPASEAGIPMIVSRWLDLGYVWTGSPAETCASYTDYTGLMILSSTSRMRMYNY